MPRRLIHYTGEVEMKLLISCLLSAGLWVVQPAVASEAPLNAEQIKNLMSGTEVKSKTRNDGSPELRRFAVAIQQVIRESS